MTDAAALDQAVRENRDVIRRAVIRLGREFIGDLPTIWCDGVGFIPRATIDLICVSYRRIVGKMNHAEEENREPTHQS